MKNIKIIFILFILIFIDGTGLWAQQPTLKNKLDIELNDYFKKYKKGIKDLSQHFYLKKCTVDNETRTITITVNADFSSLDFTKARIKKIKKDIKHILPDSYKKYAINIISNGLAIDEIVMDIDHNKRTCLWGDNNYCGNPWTENTSRPNEITHGLNNRHIAIWASHGRYYDQTKKEWKWQRPNMFCTNEDLFTQTIVVPYLIPMLENAGAVIFTPRERDWQINEVIVDNDNEIKPPYYQESSNNKNWSDTGVRGFRFHSGNYSDGENPFESGTARMTEVTKRDNNLSEISYQPSVPEEGRYAVYVSYQSLPNSIDDAQYIVYHKGNHTNFKVNQQMGGGTWVYLGTFDFDKGCNQYNRVVLTNNSSHRKGVVTGDAVRFGGGMGNIQRGSRTSGLPRALEGARYYAQWAGAPYSVYSSKGGTDDYGDDINTRSLMTNWLSGGSVYVPTLDGEKVPIELSLAIHSNAGYTKDSCSNIGSLTICTTDFNGGRLSSGVSRMASKDFASALLSGIDKDIKQGVNKSWNCFDIYDRNYSETRIPEIPSTILESMSHQNFPDMIYGQDPNFRFLLARSVYKTILKYISNQHGCPCIVQPLTPNNFSVDFVNGNKIKLSWKPTEDLHEPTANPTSYNVYISSGTGGFDNGHKIMGTSYTMDIDEETQYNFRVTAVNRGGESFPTETLSAYYNSKARNTVLIVNGFHRLSSPKVINTATEQGFNIEEDPGVSYGLTAGWIGKQECFDKSKIGIEGPGGLGYSNNELAGHFIAGNEFNYARVHAEAISSTGLYNVASCSSEAVEKGKINLQNYDCVDLILGLEKDDGHSLNYYKTFTPKMQRLLTAYTKNKGRLFISGSYIGTDMKETDEKQFLSNILKLQCTGRDSTNIYPTITGNQMTFDIYGSLNDKHYASTSSDILQPVLPAYSIMKYGDGNEACVAYKGDTYRCVTMGFPFECIVSASNRKSIMNSILKFLINN